MKISCLMVTQPGREHFAQLAVKDFNAQNWPDKELVIVNDDGRTLGELRNETMDRANGEVVAIWDDDDRRSKDYLTLMVAHLTDADAVFLRTVTFKCSKCGGVTVSRPRRWECTMVAKKALVPLYDSDMDVAEDHDLVMRMDQSGRRMATVESPRKYFKLHHSSNTIDHFPLMKKAGHRCSPS